MATATSTKGASARAEWAAFEPSLADIPPMATDVMAEAIRRERTLFGKGPTDVAYFPARTLQAAIAHKLPHLFAAAITDAPVEDDEGAYMTAVTPESMFFWTTTRYEEQAFSFLAHRRPDVLWALAENLLTHVMAVPFKLTPTQTLFEVPPLVDYAATLVEYVKLLLPDKESRWKELRAGMLDFRNENILHGFYVMYLKTHDMFAAEDGTMSEDFDVAMAEIRLLQSVAKAYGRMVDAFDALAAVVYADEDDAFSSYSLEDDDDDEDDAGSVFHDIPESDADAGTF